MKPSFLRNAAVLSIVAALSLQAIAQSEPAGYVDFGKITPPSNGGEFVEVNLKSNLIAMVAKLTKEAEPAVGDLLRGLQAVRVNVVGLDDKNRADVEEQVKKLRADLERKGWEKIVTAQEKNQDVGVFVRLRGEEAIEGVVVTVLEGGHQAVLVNVVGDIKPEKIAELGQRLNIEPLKKVGEAIKKS